MSELSLDVRRKEGRFQSKPSRVIAKSYLPGGETRAKHIIKRILALSDEKSNQLLADLLADFSSRHKNIEQIFKNNFAVIKEWIPEKIVLSAEKQCLIGAYFTHEYSIQAAAFLIPPLSVIRTRAI